jgi:hypothetical protein
MNIFRRLLFGAGKAPDLRCCRNCDHFNNEPAMLEEHFNGVNILSSVRGSSRGDAGICKLHDQYLLPVHGCTKFMQKQ